MSHKSRINFNVPGKTFLMGEYLVLQGGGAILTSTHPFFQVQWSEIASSGQFHRESPAGRYIQEHRDFFRNKYVQVNDPYRQAGGFGGSTAEFLATYLFEKYYDSVHQQKYFSFQNSVDDVLVIWQTYRNLFRDMALPPSGADVVSQVMGELCYFEPAKKQIQALDWPFHDVHLCLYKTNRKVRTHEHLRELDLSALPLSTLQQLVSEALECFVKEDIVGFIERSRAYTAVLHRHSLQSWQPVCEEIEKLPGVVHARGCGAMGADVIAVYTEATCRTDFSRFDLEYIARVPENLATGIWMEVC